MAGKFDDILPGIAGRSGKKYGQSFVHYRSSAVRLHPNNPAEHRSPRIIQHRSAPAPRENFPGPRSAQPEHRDRSLSKGCCHRRNRIVRKYHPLSMPLIGSLSSPRVKTYKLAHVGDSANVAGYQASGLGGVRRSTHRRMVT